MAKVRGAGRRGVVVEQAGFTLVELLVVVIVIGVLAAIAVPVFLHQRDLAREGSVQADLRNVMGDMESTFARTSSYPTTGEVTLRPSPDVTLTIVRPPPTGTSYCVSAVHAALPDRVWHLDSTEASVRPGGCPV